MIQQLVYISSPRSPVTEEECDTILAQSRRNNARAGIGGVLVVGHSRFLQMIEGPPEAVAAAFARIKADPRHYAVVVISDGADQAAAGSRGTTPGAPAGQVEGADAGSRGFPRARRAQSASPGPPGHPTASAGPAPLPPAPGLAA